MFDRILNDSDLLCDEYKIYPCVATDFTMIKKWADEGKYIPNADKDKDYLKVLGKQAKEIHQNYKRLKKEKYKGALWNRAKFCVV